MTEISLFANEEIDDNQQIEKIETTLPDKKGELKADTKQYTFSSRSTTTSSQAKVKQTFTKNVETKNKLPTPMKTAMNQMSSRSQTAPKSSSLVKTQSNASFQKGEAKRETQSLRPSTTQSTSSQKAHDGRRLSSEKRAERHETLQNRAPNSPPLSTRQWAKQETKQWWEARYHQREREGGKDQQQQDQEKEDEKFRLSKTASVSSNKRSSSYPQKGSGQAAASKKPALEPPKLGVFALYYILTKLGIASDATSNFACKNEIERVDLETTEAHKKRLDEMREAIKQEDQSARWSVAVKVFSWIGSLLAIISGIALIATGVGAVAGAMILAGGLIQITNQILELSGGWKKIADSLPGDDPEKKKAVVCWMQIGVAVLCLILSGAGVVWGGFSNFGAALQTAQNMMSGIAIMGGGVTTIGEGVSTSKYKDKMGEVKRYETILAGLKHKRRDLMETVEWGIDRLEKLFEELAQALEFEVELFRAEQSINRR